MSYTQSRAMLVTAELLIVGVGIHLNIPNKYLKSSRSNNLGAIFRKVTICSATFAFENWTDDALLPNIWKFP